MEIATDVIYSVFIAARMKSINIHLYFGKL